MPVFGEGTGGRFGAAEDSGKFKSLLQAGKGWQVRVTRVNAGPDHGETHTARRSGLRPGSPPAEALRLLPSARPVFEQGLA